MKTLRIQNNLNNIIDVHFGTQTNNITGNIFLNSLFVNLQLYEYIL